MAVNDIYRCEIFQNVGSEISMNVLHMRETIAETIFPFPADAVIQAITGLYDVLAGFLSEDWRVIQISARKISSGSGIPRTIVLGAAEAIVGAVEDEIVPSASAVILSLYSLTNDRTGRGRMFIMGLPELYQNEGQMTETEYTLMSAAVNNYFTNEQGPFLGGDGAWRFCIHGGGASPTDQWDVATTTLRPNLGTMKSRRAFPGFAP